MTLPKGARLRRSVDVRHVLNLKQTVAGPLAALYWHDRHDSQGPRIAVIASRRVGQAVQRNLVRRRIKEILRQKLSVLGQARDFVVIARGRAAQATYEQLETELSHLIQRSALRKRKANSGISRGTGLA